MNNNELDKTLQFVNNTYDQLTYFDLYGTSVLQFIFLTLFVFFVYAYCKIIQTKEDIANDWVNQRCHPMNIPFAGLITHPEGKSAFEYTSENFQYCVQSILTNITEEAVQPTQYMLSAVTSIFAGIAASIQKMREMMNNIRKNMQTITAELFGRILGVMIPIQRMFIALKDIFGQIQGTMVASLYTMLGSYYTLQSFMGATLEFIVKLLFVMVAVIVGLWAVPFTWPVAASTSAVFLSISVPLAVIVLFMKEVLHVNTTAIPKLRCFDGNTPIPLFHGTTIPIKDVVVGDVLFDGSIITSTIVVSSAGLDMFQLNGIVVSESHLVQWKDKWIRVGSHPDAVRMPNYECPVLYCLNTTNKKIVLNDIVFSDWDEILDMNMNVNIKKESFDENALVEMKGGMTKQIKDICIGDLLVGYSEVYGMVQMGNNMWHMLTSDGYVKINGQYIPDYNRMVDSEVQYLKCG